MTTTTEAQRRSTGRTSSFLLAASLLVPLPAAADVAKAAEAARLLIDLRAAHPGTQFTEVAITAVPGIYEVWMSGNVAYVAAANPRIFMFGRLFDTEAMRDLTGPKLADRNAEAQGGSPSPAQVAAPQMAFDQLPLADAITVRRGAGSRQLAVFSDPGCGYCRQLEVELASLDDVTIHTFLVPFLGESRPIAIWCAADRELAWHRWMLQGDASGLQPDARCDHPIVRNLALARSLRVAGTPTLFWADGSRTDGYIDREVIRSRLQAAGRPTTSAAAAKALSPRTPEQRP